VIWQEVRACDGTFLPDNEGTPAWIKKKNGWAYLKRVPTHNEQNAINVRFTQERAHSNPQNKHKKNKKDIEETATTMIDWDDEDEDSMSPPLIAQRTYINNGGDESSLESDENSVPDSRGYYDSEDEDEDDNGPPPLIPRFAADYDSKDDEDIALSNIDKERADKIGPNTWLADIGASCHLTNSDDGMFDVHVISSPVKIGNRKALTATEIGKMRRTIIQKNGDTVDITLTEVKYVEDLWVNLFSIGKGLQNGFNIGNKGINIFLMKGKTTIMFDKIMRTNKR
jgi:hypothetical protein